MATLHINANQGDFAKVVIMPGDPKRAESIALRFLHDIKIVSNVRGIIGYTGYTHHGKRVSVMASGMGQPSIGIYAHELYVGYDVDLIIRVGTAGSFNPSIHVRDILVADRAHTRSNFAYQLDRKNVIDCEGDKEVADVAMEYAKNYERQTVRGTIYTNDAFYGETKRMRDIWATKGYIGVEMESFALYYTAQRHNKRAISLLTVSNHFINEEEELTIEEKQTSMRETVSLAIDIAEHFA